MSQDSAVADGPAPHAASLPSDAQCDKLAADVGRTKLATHASSRTKSEFDIKFSRKLPLFLEVPEFPSDSHQSSRSRSRQGRQGYQGYSITVRAHEIQCILNAYCALGLLLWTTVPSVLGRCWLGGRKGIRPVKN